MVYLIKQEIRQGTLFKVGFTHSQKRFNQYATHNPTAVVVEQIRTYRKTIHSLEKAIHSELKQLGYEFITASNGQGTEWFFVPMEQEKEFELQGLKQFKACKNRKVMQVL